MGALPYVVTVAGVDNNTTVSGAGRTGTLASIDFPTAHAFSVGQSIFVELLTGPSGFAALNGSWTIVSLTSTRIRFDTDTSGTITLSAATGTVSLNLLGLPPSTAGSTPYIELDSFTASVSGDGGGRMSFDVVQAETPGGGPWWKSGSVADNARVRFLDTRYHATTALFLGYITGIEARVLASGFGTRATVSVADADGWLGKTVVRKSYTGTDIYQQVGSFKQGGDTMTDRDHINKLLARIHTQVNDATTRQILDTSIISGSTRAIYTGSAVTLGALDFKATTLTSALSQIAEEASGENGLPYSFYVDGAARLNYGPITVPASATAPAEVVTDPSSTQTGSVSTPTRLHAYNLSVTLNHDDVVKGIFVQAADSRADRDGNATPITNEPYFRTYTGTAPYSGSARTARTGPLAQEVFSAPKVAKFGFGSRSTKIQRLTKGTMQVRSKPVRSVSFSISGGSLTQTSSPDWEYGLVQGYSAAGSLVKAWLTSQYVKVTAAELDLNEVLRVASVTYSFESGGSYQLRVGVEAEYTQRSVVASLLAKFGGR